MKYLVMFLALAPVAALAQSPQDASAAEARAVQSIVECMVPGLPENWRRAVMVVALAKPGDETGAVKYLVQRGDSEEELEPFMPCDAKKPARTLIEARRLQLPRRRGWTGARLSILPDGKFALKYDYPQ